MNEQVIANHVVEVPGDGVLSGLSCHFGISRGPVGSMAASPATAAWPTWCGQGTSPEGGPTPPSEGERSHIGADPARKGLALGPETFSAQRRVGGWV